ncbi:response regulator transcription factor [Amycolatopsis minnesotensis]
MTGGQTLFREALRTTLTLERDFVVLGDPGDHVEATKMAAESRPDVILMEADNAADVSVKFTRLAGASPASRVIVLSADDDPALVRETLAMDASGYLTKNVSLLELVTAIRSVVNQTGRVVLSISKTSLAQLNGFDRGDRLSTREREILERVAQGLSNNQIAARLSIAEGTVKRHLHNVFVKLGAVSRIDAINKATHPDGPQGNGHHRPDNGGTVPGQC